MTKLPKKLAVLASGNGSTFEYLAKAIPSDLGIKLKLICSRPDARALGRAKNLRIEAEVAIDEIALRLSLKSFAPDLVVLAGYLKRVPSDIVDCYNGRMINVHPSLLPKYGGQGMYGHKVHQAVFSAKEAVTGATVHLVDSEFDTGKIIKQVTYKIHTGDTPESIESAVKGLEKELLVSTVLGMLKGQVIK